MSLAALARPPRRPPAVFAEIDVAIEVYEYEGLDLNAIEVPRPIRLGAGFHLRINGGRAEGRVPGLAILADGAAVREVGSAVSPPQYSYQHYPGAPTRNQRAVLELRYRGASFALRTETLAGEITAPAADQVVPAGEPLVVRWSGDGSTAPERIDSKRYDAGQAWRCRVGYTRASLADREAIFVPLRDTGAEARDPPCTGEVQIEWTSPARTLSSPFRSLTMAVSLRRFRRFQIH